MNTENPLTVSLHWGNCVVVAHIVALGTVIGSQTWSRREQTLRGYCLYMPASAAVDNNAASTYLLIQSV